MDIWLIRHGETDWNIQKRVQGWTDVPLNATGHKQAELLAASLEGIPFKHIYSSDLIRAHDTAKAIARRTGAAITTTKALREQYFGQGEGLLASEKERRFPNGAPDEESRQMLEARIGQFLQQVADTHRTGRVILAAHGRVIGASLTWLGHKRVIMNNTSITRLRVTDGEFQIIAVNTTPHLDTFNTATSGDEPLPTAKMS